MSEAGTETSNLTPEQVTEEVAKLEAEETKGEVTSVTTLAEEEKKTGKKPLTKEEMKNMAAQDFIAGMAQLQAGFRKLSARGVRRLFIATLQLPEEGTQVHLQGNDERAMFGIAQRVLNARTSLILHFISEASEKAKLETNTQNEETVTNESTKSE